MVYLTIVYCIQKTHVHSYLRKVRDPGNLIPTLWSRFFDFGADFSKMLLKVSLKFEFWSQVPSLLKQLSQVWFWLLFRKSPIEKFHLNGFPNWVKIGKY